MTGNPGDSLLSAQPHRRLNALTGEWVFVSPQRTLRPWHGRQEPKAVANLPPHDPDCYLCPGTTRANGARNPPYASTFVFDNDFPAFLDTDATAPADRSPLLVARVQRGACRVICYSPRHDLSLAQLPRAQRLDVVDTWAAQEAELRQRWRWVQVFENRGELMGCSNPHPHGQVWAGDFIPNEAAREQACQRRWLQEHGTPLLLDYAQLELGLGERLVTHDAHWIALVPWWAVWPFETLVIPRRHRATLAELDAAERGALADLLARLVGAYDRLFGVTLPYSFGWHGAPGKGSVLSESDGGQLHAHFYPPLLRSATVRKFMVGYELLAEAQRDLTPESAAARLQRAALDVTA